jgi:hypothetical protein
MRLSARPPQQSTHQMLIDGAQSVHAHGLPKLMEHPGGGERVPQPGEAPPRHLFGQLRHEKVERMRGSQHRQQMRAPQLRRTQGVPPSAGKMARPKCGDEIVGSVRTQQFKQAVGADRRQGQTHAWTLTHTSPHDTPLVSV